MKTAIAKLSNRVEQVEKSGGGSSDTEYQTSVTTLNKEDFISRRCYVPFGVDSEKHCEAKIFIKVNDESFYRYYIEAFFDNTVEPNCGYKVFINSSAPTDSVDLNFELTECPHSDVEGTQIGLSIMRLSQLTSDTFTIYKQYTYKGNLATDGDVRISNSGKLYMNTKFVPFIPSA